MKAIKLLLGMVVLAVTAVACSAKTAVPTLSPPPTPTPTAHTDDADEPAHIHLDDGSTLTTEGAAPLQEDIWELLLAGNPIVVGTANESVETAVLTIPTMF